jgi:hypothetical protein
VVEGIRPLAPVEGSPAGYEFTVRLATAPSAPAPPSARPRGAWAIASSCWAARRPLNTPETTMLYTIAVVLVILWALGLVTSVTMGGFIHVAARDRHRRRAAARHQRPPRALTGHCHEAPDHHRPRQPRCQPDAPRAGHRHHRRRSRRPAQGRQRRNLRRAQEALTRAHAAIRSGSSDAAEATGEFVDAHPWQAIGLAAFAGLLAGVLFARR